MIELRDQLANLGSAFETQVRSIPFDHRGRLRAAAWEFAHQLLRLVAEEEAAETSKARRDGQLRLFTVGESRADVRSAHAAIKTVSKRPPHPGVRNVSQG